MNPNRLAVLAAVMCLAAVGHAATALQSAEHDLRAVLKEKSFAPSVCPITEAPKGQWLPAAAKGDAAPDFTLKDLAGREVSLSQHKGKIVLLDFWASWCPPCRMSTPFLSAMHDKYAAKGLVVLGINIREPRSAIASYAAENQMPYAILRDEDGSVAGQYRVRGIPAFMIIGRDGKVLWTQVGFSPATAGSFENAIVSALK